MTREARIAAITLVVLVLALWLESAIYASKSGMPMPEGPHQPIDFFHRVHAGDKQISCYFCHRTAGTAAFAGMPAVATCMRCHRVVIPNHFEIQRLHDFWESGTPIPWERVNHLPGFVFFDHHAHVARGVQCKVCHGPVTTMDRLKQTAPLSMGWCLGCHQQKSAPTSCITCHR